MQFDSRSEEEASTTPSTWSVPGARDRLERRLLRMIQFTVNGEALRSQLFWAPWVQKQSLTAKLASLHMRTGRRDHRSPAK